MVKRIVVLLGVLALARAQIPSLGFCPDYVPMVNFDMQRFVGPWYEAERYFQLTEVASRCVMSNYTKGNDGKYHVSNEITSRFTGIRRILDGEIRIPENKRDEGKIVVRYTSVPLITPETTYSILETDYENYAVMWSCSGVGPVHTQNAWIMTRKRLAPGEILQKAYAVLDKYKISKTFFVKTDQDDCAFLELPRPYRQKPEDQADEDLAEDEPVRAAQPGEPHRGHLITPDAPEIIKTQLRNSAQPIDIVAQPEHQPQADQPVVEVKAAEKQQEKLAELQHPHQNHHHHPESEAHKSSDHPHENHHATENHHVKTEEAVVPKSAEPVPQVAHPEAQHPVETVKTAEPAPVKNLEPVLPVQEVKTVPETIMKIAEEHQVPATELPSEKSAAIVEELPKEEPVKPLVVPESEIVPPVAIKDAPLQQDQPIVVPQPELQHQKVVPEPLVKITEEIKQVPI